MNKPISIVFASLLAFTPEACSHAVGSGNGPDPSPGLAAQRAASDAPPSAGAPLAAAGGTPTAGTSAAGPRVYRVPVDGLPSMGDPEAPVTIVEFTDYQCPYCQKAEHTVVRLRATYGDALRVVIAERPLPFHDHARPAALAALAANAQGKFEPMHERLFALGKQLDDAAVASAAADAGVDLSRAYDDGTLARSEKLADTLGVTGTPTFFVDGRMVQGAQPYETFRDVVDERLAAARALVASGTPARDVYAALVANGSAHVETDAVDHPENCGAN
ncbi:MAG TPA: thioredoxin domain-containing protein, partial [Polyangiaceae bacterium]